MTSTLYTEYIIHCVKETRQVIGNTMVKLRLDHNNLDKAMANNNPSVIECQHIAWCPVLVMVSVYLYSLCGLACSPVSSVVHVGGGRTEATAEAAQWPCPASQPLDMGRYSLNIFYHWKYNLDQRKSSVQDHVVSQQILSGVCVVCWADYVPTGRPSDGSEWCVESPSPRGRRGQWRPGQSPVLTVWPVSAQSSLSALAPLTLLLSPGISQHRTPGPRGHQETSPRPGWHQQGNNSESSSSIIHSPPASREPGTHHWPEADCDQPSLSPCEFPFVFIPDVHFMVAREMNDIWGEVFLSIIGSVYQSVWLLVMFAPIPLSLIFIKLFWAHRQNKKWTFSNGNVYLALKETDDILIPMKI